MYITFTLKIKICGMLKKILWSILIILVLYLVSIFIVPVQADKIGDIFWITRFNEKVRQIKEKMDNMMVALPSEDEIRKAAEDIKNNATDWANKLKDSVDNVRETLNNTAEQYEELKKEAEETKKQIEEGIDALSWAISPIKDMLSNESATWTTLTWSGQTE